MIAGEDPEGVDSVAGEESQEETQKEIMAELEANLEISPETLVHMVIRVQRAYRLTTYVYRHFGPTLFVDSTGQPSYGQIKFEGHLETAPWVRVAPSASPLRLVKLFDYHWKLPKPEVIITVTGGAQDFALTSQQLLSFDRGLCSAALSAKAWIFTAGSDAGVMRLVGDAMARHEVGLPLIGIFPWGVTNGRGQLASAVNGTTPYRPSPPTRQGAPLNPNHTHFVLVDSGTEGGAAFGTEIKLRSDVEATVSNMKNVPIVQLVVQGGPGTLATVESTALAGKPIVILTDSGGAATAIYDYCMKGLDGVAPNFKSKEAVLRTIMQLNEAYGKKQLTFFKLSDEGKGFGDRMHDMSSSLLDAIVKMMNSPPAYETLPVGAHLRHPDYGFGAVREITSNGARVVGFDSGDKYSVAQDHVWTQILVEGEAAAASAAPKSRKQSIRLRHLPSDLSRPAPLERNKTSSLGEIAAQATSKSQPKAANRQSELAAVSVSVAPNRGSVTPRMAETARKHHSGRLERFVDKRLPKLSHALHRQFGHFGSNSEGKWDENSMGIGTLDPAETSAQPDPLLTKTLVLTVTWNRPELARRILSGLEGNAGQVKAGSLAEIAVAMQRALELQRFEMVRLFIQLPGFAARRINIGRLFLQPDETKFLSNNRNLQARVRSLDHHAPYQQEVADERRIAVNYFGYQKALLRFYYGLSPVLSHLLRTTTCTQPHDIFLWLVCTGAQEGIARAVWPKCDLPVHMALLGAHVANRMAKVIMQGAAAAEERAARMQEWAYGAMEMAPDESHAHHVLELSISGRYTALDIALRTQNKTFLSQRHCLTLMDEWWRGGSGNRVVHLPEGFNWGFLVMEALFPLLNRHLWHAEDEEEKSAAGPSNVYDALAMYMNISASERARVQLAQSQVDGAAASPDASTKTGPSAGTSIFKPIRGLFEGSVAKAESHLDRNASLYRRVVDFYSVPYVKFVFRVLAQAAVTTMYVIMIFNFDDPDDLDKARLNETVAWNDKFPLISKSHHEMLWLFFETGIFLDQKHQNLMRSRTDAPPHGKFFSVVRLIDNCLIVSAMGIRVSMEFYADELGDNPCVPNELSGAEGGFAPCLIYDRQRKLYTAYQVIISLKTIVVCFQSLTYLSVYKPLGVLIIMVEEMIQDVLNFILLFMVVTFAFMLGMVGLQMAGMYRNTDAYDTSEGNAHQYDPFFNVGSFWGPLWALFGMFDPMQLDWLPSVLVWLYSFIGAIVLVNLLIASFADTFMRVKQQSEVEAIYADCLRLFAFRDVLLAVPPVLNAPIIIYDFFQLACSKTTGRGRRRNKSSAGGSDTSLVLDSIKKRGMMSLSQRGTALVKYLSNDRVVSRSTRGESVRESVGADDSPTPRVSRASSKMRDGAPESPTTADSRRGSLAASRHPSKKKATPRRCQAWKRARGHWERALCQWAQGASTARERNTARRLPKARRNRG